jgi:hypothetical protein
MTTYANRMLTLREILCRHCLSLSWPVSLLRWGSPPEVGAGQSVHNGHGAHGDCSGGRCVAAALSGRRAAGFALLTPLAILAQDAGRLGARAAASAALTSGH